MGKLAISLAAAALMLGSMAVTAGAQTQQAGASSFNTMLRNASPVQEVACRGHGGACPWGWYRVCNPYRCWCRPC